MQIISKKGLIPLTIATGLTLPSSIAYADVDQFSNIISVISDARLAKYVKSVDNRYDNNILIRSKFHTYYNSWHAKTRFLSSAKAITEQIDFKNIVSLGLDAVPFILETIDTKPSTLVWALNMIFKEKISNDPNLTISEACNLWVKKLK